MSNWPYDKVFRQPEPGMIQQELVTYRKRSDGAIIRETIVRRFFGKNDYQDSTSTEVLNATN